MSNWTFDHHLRCRCGCGELADECSGQRPRLLGSVTRTVHQRPFVLPRVCGVCDKPSDHDPCLRCVDRFDDDDERQAR